MTQEQFAAAGGVTVQTQRNYESDRRVPDSKYLNKIQNAGADAYRIIAEQSEGAVPLLVEPDELKLLNAYHSLNENDKSLLTLYLDALVGRSAARGTNKSMRIKATKNNS